MLGPIHTLDRFLNRCTDDELNDLLGAFQAAAARRAERTAANGG